MSSEKKAKATTSRGVTALINQGITGMHAAGDGLYLRVRSKGSASWVFRYTLNGKAKNMGIGSTDGLPLAEAKAEAVKLRALLSRGIDPQQDRQEKEALAAAEVVTFDMVAADYIAIHSVNWVNAKHHQQWINTLATYASPVIGQLPPAEITIQHMLKILRPIWNEKKETASRLRNRIELVLKLARSRKLFAGENVAAWDGVLEFELANNNVNKRRHHPALPWAQSGKFWQALESEQDTGAKALQLTMLTALRTKEILGAHWSEFDLVTNVWTVPAVRMKGRKGKKSDHRVPLSTAALELLATIPKVSSGYLFEGRTAGKPASNMLMLMRVRRMDAAKHQQDRIGWRDKDGDIITPHGFRSTFRDWAAENTLTDNIVVEQALAHAIGDAVEEAYRRGDLLERRRELMEAWGQYVTQQMLSPAKEKVAANSAQ